MLVFAALKLGLSDFMHIPAGLSLAIIAGILAAATAAHLVRKGGAKKASMPSCAHRGQIRDVQPADTGCTACKAMGDTWVHLRMCMTCGHVGP